MDQTIESFIHTQLVNQDLLKGIIRSHYDGNNESSETVPAESFAIARKLIDDRRKRLIDAYEKGLISVDELNVRLGKLDVENRTLPVVKPKNSGGISRERLIQLVVKGAAAFARIQSTTEKNRTIKKMFSKIIVSDASITGFMLHPSIAAFCTELGSPSDRDSSPPRA